MNEEFAEETVAAAQEGGHAHVAPSAGQQLAERLHQGADYLRSLEPDELREEIEDSIRARPLLSVGLAACAGFLIGRLIRR